MLRLANRTRYRPHLAASDRFAGSLAPLLPVVVSESYLQFFKKKNLTIYEDQQAMSASAPRVPDFLFSFFFFSLVTIALRVRTRPGAGNGNGNNDGNGHHQYSTQVAGMTRTGTGNLRLKTDSNSSTTPLCVWCRGGVFFGFFLVCTYCNS